MPLTIQQSAYFLADVEIQFRWYFEKVDLEVAQRYRMAVQATILKLQQRLLLGRPRFRNDPDLKGDSLLHSGQAFCQTFAVLERTIHGARNLPRRLKQPPGTND